MVGVLKDCTTAGMEGGRKTGDSPPWGRATRERFISRQREKRVSVMELKRSAEAIWEEMALNGDPGAFYAKFSIW